MYQLTIRDGAKIIKRYFIDKKNNKIIIGSSSKCNIYIDHKMISEQHCEIKKTTPADWSIIDLNSAFGVSVNNARISEPAKLNSNDIIGISPYEMDFVLLNEQKQQIKDRFCLICISGKMIGTQYLLYKQLMKIGRDPNFNDIIIPASADPMVSRRHITIVNQDGRYILSDKRSTNRTLINNIIINPDEETVLNLDDEIIIGRQIFRFTKEQNIRLSEPVKSVLPFTKFMKKTARYIIIPFVIMFSMLVLYESIKGLLMLKKTTTQVSFTAGNPVKMEDITNMKNLVTPHIFISGNNKMKNLLLQNVWMDFEKIGLLSLIKPVNLVGISLSGKISYLTETNNTINVNMVNDIGTTITSYPALYDFDKDGVDDIVIHGGDSRLYVIDGRSGKIMLKTKIIGYSEFSSPAVFESKINNNITIMDPAQEGKIYLIQYNFNTYILSQIQVEGDVTALPVLFNQKKNTNVLLATKLGKLFIIDGTNLAIKDKYDIRTLVTDLLRDEFQFPISAAPAIGNINRDKEEEIVVVTDNNYVIAINNAGNRVLWQPVLLTLKGNSISPDIRSSCVLSDIDRDGIDDIIVLSPDGIIFGISGISGKTIYIYDTGIPNNICPLALTDFDNNGMNELIFGTPTGELFILNFSQLANPDKSAMFEEKLFNNPINCSPIIADINKDGLLEIVAASIANEIRVIHTSTKVLKNQLTWPVMQGNTSHTGTVSKTGDLIVQSAIFIIIGLTALLITVFIFYIKRKPGPEVKYI